MRTTGEQADIDGQVWVAWSAHRFRDRTVTYAEAFVRWQSTWDASDFSWEGLADAGWGRDNANEAQYLKRWQAPPDFPGEGLVRHSGDAAWKEATLQDYWRWVPGAVDTLGQPVLLDDAALRAAGLLIEIDGRLWHALHRPEMCASATPESREQDTNVLVEASEASSRSARALEAALLARMATSAPRGGVDLRLQLAGARANGIDVCWRTFAGSPQDGAPAPTIHISAPLAGFNELNAYGLSFGDGAEFKWAAFGVGARFDRVSFGKLVSFDGATFGDRILFNASIFGDEAEFDRAIFGNQAAFHGTAFGKDASFHCTAFGHEADFGLATFDDRASLFGATFGDGAWFAQATFGEKAALGSSTFGNDAAFDDATFGRGVRFGNAIFVGGTRFSGATFGEEAWFDHVTFGGQVVFRASEFKGYVTFEDVTWPASASHQQAAFEGCRFRDLVNFKTSSFAAFSLFDGAELHSRLLLAEPVKGTTSADELFHRSIVATTESVATDVTTPSKSDDPQLNERGADARFGALAGGLRTLRKAMAQQGDIMREHRFYRYELIARARRPSEPTLAKGATWIYGLVSDYGAAIGRPLVTLVALMGLFGLVYWGMAAALAIPWQIEHLPQPWTQNRSEHFGHSPALDAWEALNFSWNNTFRPLSALSAEVIGPKEPSWASHLLYGFGPGWGWAVRLVATLQSLCAIVLAFLLALAIRRRFQIT